MLDQEPLSPEHRAALKMRAKVAFGRILDPEQRKIAFEAIEEHLISTRAPVVGGFKYIS